VLAAAILACSSLAAPTAPPVDVGTLAASTLEAFGAPASVPAPTDAAPSGTSVSFENVRFAIPQGLASGAACETVPAVDEQSGAPWEVAPAYARCTLQAYPLQGMFFRPQIMVYPAPQYAAASAGATNSIQRLQAILAGPSPALGNDGLPRLPYANADQIIGAQPTVLPFTGGGGVRVLAEYAQYFAPINNHELFYHFEGLTSDGKSYIVTTLPVNAAFLAGESDPAASIPADGIPFPGIDVTNPSAFSSYYQAVTDRLSTTAPDAFRPALASLDALIGSLQVSP
jgi:hypothetical protein